MRSLGVTTPLRSAEGSHVQKQRPVWSLIVLLTVATLFIAALFVMIHHHNQGANLRSPPAASGGPA